jgi:hypothetical protein
MVINVKWGVYAAIVALVLAFTTSIALGQASFGAAVLRGLAFAGLFFALGTGAWTLINNYIPELLFPDANNDAAANIFGSGSSGIEGSDSQSYGSRINITLGDGSEAALPDNNVADAEEVGNIADLVSGAIDPAEEAKRKRGLDGIADIGYTGSGEGVTPSLTGFGESASLSGFAEPAAPAADNSGGFNMNFDSFALGGGGGGLEPFGDSFSLPTDSAAKEKDAFVPERKVMGNTPMALEGDFNPKDIALGIRTVLETDKRG